MPGAEEAVATKTSRGSAGCRPAEEGAIHAVQPPGAGEAGLLQEGPGGQSDQRKGLHGTVPNPGIQWLICPSLSDLWGLGTLYTLHENYRLIYQ